MRPSVAKRLRLLASVVSVLVVLAAAFAAWFYFRLRASLPQLEGRTSVPGLAASATVERDAEGVPNIRGANRSDVARALGFLHGQERFFQMDLARRRPAGELSALIGKATIEADKRARLHGFRAIARAALSRLPAEQKSLLEAYAQGVNAGLSQLRSKPFEYLVLRTDPKPWTPEDSVLIIYAMTLDLQEDQGGYEQSLAAVRDTLGAGALAYFAPLIGPEDAALDGSLAPLSAMPSEHTIDLRQQANEGTAWLKIGHDDDSVMLGSNGFALAGTRTATGAGMVANDMHLNLRLPNIWYRASLNFPHPVSGAPIRVTGVTIPGTPVVVAGSNGRIAWGFTNADADMSDIVPLDSSSLDPDSYVRGKEILSIEKRRETIEVKGSDPVDFEAPWSEFGPIVGTNNRGRRLAFKWTADDPATANFSLVELETADTVEQAVTVAHRSGIPIQNFVVADSTGKIGWTICGKLPKRVGFDGRLPVTWTYGDRRWDGFVPDDQVPAVIAPSAGQIWTANQRILDSESLLVLGDGGYERPQRAARIRDLLTEIKSAKPEDLLRVQLDTRAPYLDRWHALLKKILTEGAIAQRKDRGKLRDALEPWSGRADVDSVSYRLVRVFRSEVVKRVLPPIFARCADAYLDFSYRRFHYEPAMWDMLERRPPHLLNPEYPSWDELLLASADAVVKSLDREGTDIARATWGQQNVARIQHPFARLIPLAGLWLSMPKEPLAGDFDTPRVQAPDNGASERFVVSPGHEDEGIFEMPGGQSGHPLSPFFGAGHEAWVKGQPHPFLPGPARYTLTLTPAP
ncbi:penicillin acylase family protein [Opitutaceae bacterium EW11]|nr:penicillin acylase family protein [Opitutaceae bacterium EW11]